MGRPPKKVPVVETPQEFNYEEHDAMYDNAYNPTDNMNIPPQLIVDTGATTQPVPNLIVPPSLVVPEEDTSKKKKISMFNKSPALATVNTGNLYLVEGDVQMMPRQMGRGNVTAKQFRLVSAESENEAIEKFSNYFMRLTDANAIYTVVRAAAMETIR